MSVFIKELVSQRVVVDGSVIKIGAYPLSGKTTLLQAIAMAGGLDPLADPTTVHIFRDKPSGEREVLTFDLLAIRGGEVADPLIKGNDTITVEESAARAFSRARPIPCAASSVSANTRSASDFFGRLLRFRRLVSCDSY